MKVLRILLDHPKSVRLGQPHRSFEKKRPQNLDEPCFCIVVILSRSRQEIGLNHFLILSYYGSTQNLSLFSCLYYHC